MAYDITLDGKNRLIAEGMLRDVAKILDNCSIQYWLEGGTLLGIRRENRLLPWDNDVDLSVLVDQSSKFEALYQALDRADYRVKTRLFEVNTEQFDQGDIRIIKIRKKRFLGLLKGPVCLEIFVKYPIDEQACWQIAGKSKQVPTRFYQSFKTIRFNDYDYVVPELTDEYLAFRYGDWQTPVKQWDTSTDDNALNQ